jgi:hypothetical protein
MIGGMALFWNGILSVFLYGIFLSPYRQKRLLRHGHEAAGRLTSMTSYQGGRGRMNSRVVYVYRVAGIEYQNATILSRHQIGDIHEGMIVRVIYDPAKPKRSIAVELSAWEISG